MQVLVADAFQFLGAFDAPVLGIEFQRAKPPQPAIHSIKWPRSSSKCLPQTEGAIEPTFAGHQVTRATIL